MSLLGLNMGLLREGLLLLGHLSSRGPLPTPPLQVEMRQVQANVENQMLMVTSDSQKRRGQVAFLSEGWPTPPSAQASPVPCIRLGARSGLGVDGVGPG